MDTDGDTIWINGKEWRRVAQFTGPPMENGLRAEVIPCRYERTENGFRLIPEEDVSIEAGETVTLKATIPKEPGP